MTRYAVPMTGTRQDREWVAHRLRQRAAVAISVADIDWSVDPPELVFADTLTANELALLASMPTGFSTATVPMAGVVTSVGGPGEPHPNAAAHQSMGLAVTAHAHAATLGTIAASGTAVTVNPATSDWDITLTAACVISIDAPPANVPTYLTIVLRGAQAVTWPGTVTWAGDAPTAPATVVLYTPNGQMPWLGAVASGHTHPGGGAHPDLATHTGLGLAASHAHPYSADTHAHDGTYEPVHSHPYAGTAHNHDASYAPTHAHPYAATSHAHVDGDIPATIARDAEVAAAYSPLAHTHAYEAAGAVAAHAAAGDPHPTYLTAAEGNAAYATTGHTHGGGSSPWTLVAKTADESKNNLAVVADDPVLQFATVANTQYTIRLRAFFLTNATADLKYRLVHTGTTTRVRRKVKRTATTDIAQTIALLTAFDAADVILSTTGLNPWLEEDVILQVGATPGVLKLQWAQVTSGPGPTTCLEGSYLEYAIT